MSDAVRVPGVGQEPRASREARPLFARALLLAAGGAVLGSLLDLVHVKTGAIRYAEPRLFGLAWWVPLIYLGAGLGIGLSHPWFDARLGRPERVEPTPGRLVAGLLGLAAVWAASGALALDARLVGAILAAGSLGLWWALDRTWQGLSLGVGTAAVGVAVELTLVRARLFSYVKPDAFGIASWLPWIYVAGSVAVGNLGRFLAGSPGTPGSRPRGGSSAWPESRAGGGVRALSPESRAREG